VQQSRIPSPARQLYADPLNPYNRHMRVRLRFAAPLLVPLITLAQGTESLSIKQMMLDRIHPAANAILLAAFRGTPDWPVVQTNAGALQEAAALLASKNTQAEWSRTANELLSAAADAATAASAKDETALAPIARRIDASCTECHKRYRPNVFPPNGKGVEQ
jgi:cytochrome c553